MMVNGDGTGVIARTASVWPGHQTLMEIHRRNWRHARSLSASTNRRFTTPRKPNSGVNYSSSSYRKASEGGSNDHVSSSVYTLKSIQVSNDSCRVPRWCPDPQAGLWCVVRLIRFVYSLMLCFLLFTLQFHIDEEVDMLMMMSKRLSYSLTHTISAFCAVFWRASERFLSLKWGFF